MLRVGTPTARLRFLSLSLVVIAAAALALSGTASGAVAKLYWSDANNGDLGVAGIWRANADGSAREALPGQPWGPWALDVDAVGQKLYWARNDVLSADLDGTGVRVVTAAPLNAIGVAVDAVARKVYWADGGAPSAGIPATIGRANLDGTGLEIILTGLGSPRELAVDPSGGKLYWTDAGHRAVERANLDGSGLETIASGLTFPSAIALDVSHGKVYWGDEGIVSRANLDGSGREFVLSAATLGLAVDEEAGKLYFADFVADSLQRSNLDGTMREVLAAGQLDTPWGIALLTVPSPPATSVVNAFGCQLNGGQVFRPAGTEIVVRQGWGTSNRGLAMDFIQAQTTTVSVNGGAPVEISDGYNQPQPIEGSPSSWVTRVEYPTGMVLAPGESMTFRFVWSVSHRLHDGISFENGEFGKPLFGGPGTSLDVSCTVTGS
jgi:DNA-binding beta-propeller fold protein YncE